MVILVVVRAIMMIYQYNYVGNSNVTIHCQKEGCIEKYAQLPPAEYQEIS